MRKFGFKSCQFLSFIILIFFAGSSNVLALCQQKPQGCVGTDLGYTQLFNDGFVFAVEPNKFVVAIWTITKMGHYRTLNTPLYSLHGFVADSLDESTSFMDTFFSITQNGDHREAVFNFDLSIYFTFFDGILPAKGWIDIVFWADHEGVDSASIIFEKNLRNYTTEQFHSNNETPHKVWTVIVALSFEQIIFFPTDGVLDNGGLEENNTYMLPEFFYTPGTFSNWTIFKLNLTLPNDRIEKLICTEILKACESQMIKFLPEKGIHFTRVGQIMSLKGVSIVT